MIIILLLGFAYALAILDFKPRIPTTKNEPTQPLIYEEHL